MTVFSTIMLLLKFMLKHGNTTLKFAGQDKWGESSVCGDCEITLERDWDGVKDASEPARMYWLLSVKERLDPNPRTPSQTPPPPAP